MHHTYVIVTFKRIFFCSKKFVFKKLFVSEVKYVLIFK